MWAKLRCRPATALGGLDVLHVIEFAWRLFCGDGVPHSFDRKAPGGDGAPHSFDRKAPAICRVVAKNADAEDAPPFVLGRWWAS